MRVRKKTWTEKELEENERIVSTPEGFKGRWGERFNNEGAIYLEIGCGKGRFVTEMALGNSGVNFIALERERHVLAAAARRAREAGCSPAFVIGDAEDIPDIFGNGEIARIYINFCDPWPNRKKWAKRRLTHRHFLDMYAAILSEGGEIFFKTDNKELFEFSLNELCNEGWQLANISLDLHKSGAPGDVATEYEQKFSAMGMPIYRLEARLRPRN